MADFLGVGGALGIIVLIVSFMLLPFLFLVAHWRIGTALHRIADNQPQNAQSRAPAATQAAVLSGNGPDAWWGTVAITLGGLALVGLVVFVLWVFLS